MKAYSEIDVVILLQNKLLTDCNSWNLDNLTVIQ